MTYAEYVEAEAKSPVKHEWLRGEVRELFMPRVASGTPEHARLAMSFGAELHAALRGRPCAVYSSDLRIKVEATALSTYPDITVVCGRAEHAADDPLALVNPTLLVEVLSDSTEAYDRGEKFAHYRRIPSLREYVLVAQRERRIEVHRLNASGHWELHEALAGESVEVLGVPIEVDAVYRDPLAAS